MSCDDGDLCNGVETCDPVAGGCQPGTPVSCDDGNPCTIDGCDPSVGCTWTPVSCNDGDACTLDICDPAQGYCNFPARNCDDGNVCNGMETCSSFSGCKPGTPLGCDDGDACNGVETCDPTAGCQPGTAPTCDDGDPCTPDGCNPVSGCTHVSNGSCPT